MRRAFFFIVAVCLATSSFASIPRTSALDASSSLRHALPETRIRVFEVLAPFERPAQSLLNRALHQSYAAACTTNASGLGRFLSVDPSMDLKRTLPNPQMWNRYSYVLNNPIRYTDPTGRELPYDPDLFKSPPPDSPVEKWTRRVAIGGAAVVAALYAGPQVLAWALTNPYTARQLVEAVGSAPGSSSVGLPNVARQLATAERIGAALKSDPSHRAASFGLEAVAKAGQTFELKGSDGVLRTLVQAPGGVNGKAGIFEYIINKAGQVTHQRFIEDGVITGLPNQKPPV